MKSRRMPEVPKGQPTFYVNEILPDLQARTRAVLREQKDLPQPVPSHVGMQAINAVSPIGRYFVEFASSSSIHGLNHLVAPHRHPIERFLAVMFILGALLCLICLSYTFWERYQYDATVIGLDNDRDLFKIPKPSYFICLPQNIAKENVSAVFKRYGVERTPEAEKFFNFLSNVTYETMHLTPDFEQVPSNKWLKILYDLRKDIGNNILKQQKVEQVWVATERGICLVLRSYVAAYSTPEYWLSNDDRVYPIPEELPHFDFEDSREWLEAIGLAEDMLVGLASPSEVLSYYPPMHEIASRTLKRSSMTVSEVITERNVVELNVRQRKCKFPEDGGLKTWPIYTMGMCTVECRMVVIENKCGCRPHFVKPMPDVPVCNAKQLRCIGDIKDELFLDGTTAPQHCGCLENCNSVNYRTEDTFKSEMNFNLGVVISTFTIEVDFPTIVYRRILLFGFNDFLTAVGGAAGLFLGASVLSFVEIFFYCTLHLCVYMKNVRKERRKRETIRRLILKEIP